MGERAKAILSGTFLVALVALIIISLVDITPESPTSGGGSQSNVREVGAHIVTIIPDSAYTHASCDTSPEGRPIVITGAQEYLLEDYVLRYIDLLSDELSDEGYSTCVWRMIQDCHEGGKGTILFVCYPDRY